MYRIRFTINVYFRIAKRIASITPTFARWPCISQDPVKRPGRFSKYRFSIRSTITDLFILAASRAAKINIPRKLTGGTSTSPVDLTDERISGCFSYRCNVPYLCTRTRVTGYARTACMSNYTGMHSAVWTVYVDRSRESVRRTRRS